MITSAALAVFALITSFNGIPRLSNFDIDVEDVLHAAVHAADVQVGADDIGIEALLGRGHGLAIEKAATAMPRVEDDAALARLQHEWTKPILRVDDRRDARRRARRCA